MTKEDKQTEQKIFDAATEIFEEKGLDAARMQDIADRAGINKALLHYYFRSKEKLFTAVFDALAERMFMKFAGIFEEEMSVEEKIRYFFRKHMDFLQKNPRLPLFILTEVNRNPKLVDRLIGKVNIIQIKSKLSKDKDIDIPEELVPHLMVTIVSMSFFPIIAKPLLKALLQKTGVDYNHFIKERIQFAPDFVISALKNNSSELKTQNNE